MLVFYRFNYLIYLAYKWRACVYCSFNNYKHFFIIWPIRNDMSKKFIKLQINARTRNFDAYGACRGFQPNHLFKCWVWYGCIPRIFSFIPIYTCLYCSVDHTPNAMVKLHTFRGISTNLRFDSSLSLSIVHKPCTPKL